MKTWIKAATIATTAFAFAAGVAGTASADRQSIWEKNVRDTHQSASLSAAKKTTNVNQAGKNVKAVSADRDGSVFKRNFRSLGDTTVGAPISQRLNVGD